MSRPHGKSEKEKLKLKISELYLKGYRQNTICNKLEISQTTVSKYLKEAINDWKLESLNNIDEKIEAELARINMLEVTAWESFQRSTENKQKTVRRQKRTQRGEETDGSIQEEQLIGDPRFLSIIQWCITKRVELMGLIMPQENKHVVIIAPEKNDE